MLYMANVHLSDQGQGHSNIAVTRQVFIIFNAKKEEICSTL